jgi:hypothetical protein
MKKNLAANGKQKFSAGREQNPISSENWTVPLTVLQGKRANKISGIGMNKDASILLDKYDGLTMPRFFQHHLELNHFKKDGDDPFSMDVVPADESHTWEFRIESNYAEELIRIEWDNASFGDNEKTLVLWDEQKLVGVDMRTTNHYEFARSASMKFKIFFGDKAEANDKAIAEQLVFHEVYPNPPDSDVNISFSVPGSGDVTFDVFDALGRKVWSQRAAYPRGRHEVNLSGIKPAGGNGLFIIQLSNSQSRQQKRLQIK